MQTTITRWWLAAAGITTLVLAAIVASAGPVWAAVVLAIMGVVTIAGGIAQARSVR